MLNNSIWITQLESELKENILGFWLKHSLDDRHGGFLGEVKRHLEVVDNASKSAVLNTRLLWTFSTAYRVYQDKQYLEAAERAFHYLNDRFIDQTYGGIYWMLNADGTPSERHKQIYAQAFAIYAFAEYYRATQNELALSQANALFDLLEKYSKDSIYGGYYEAKAEDWSETTNYSLSGKDLNEAKSMNTHLHILEAYTNLYRISPSIKLAERVEQLIVITIEHIVDKQSGHFRLFFNDAWEAKSTHISYGHDIEGSWLLVEAADVLGHKQLSERVIKVALKMADAVLINGVDADGGLFNEADEHGIIDDHKDWWPQAEAVVGFYNAYQLTHDEKYKKASQKAWRFIQDYIVDKQYGEWHWSVHRNGTPSDNDRKISAWKCPYHNSRACFEMLKRLK